MNISKTTRLPKTAGTHSAMLSGFLSKLVTIASNILILPLAFAFLDELQFATFMIFLGIAQWASFSGLGMESVVAKRHAPGSALDSVSLFEFRVARTLTAVVSGGVGLIIAIILFHWVSSSDELLEVQADLYISIGVLLIYLFGIGHLQVYSGVLIGQLQTWVVNVFRAFGSVVTLSFALIVVPFVPSVAGLLFAVIIGPIVGQLMIVLFSRRYWVGVAGPVSGQQFWPTATALLKQGYEFFMIQGVNVLLYGVPPFLVANFYGVANSDVFSVLIRSLALMVSFGTVISNPIWPGMLRARSFPEVYSFWSVVTLPCLASLLISIGAAIVFAFKGGWILQFWVGIEVLDYNQWGALFGFSILVSLLNQLSNSLLIGFGRQTRAALVNLLSLLLCLSVGLVMAYYFGPRFYFLALAGFGALSMMINAPVLWRLLLEQSHE